MSEAAQCTKYLESILNEKFSATVPVSSMCARSVSSMFGWWLYWLWCSIKVHGCEHQQHGIIYTIAITCAVAAIQHTLTHTIQTCHYTSIEHTNWIIPWIKSFREQNVLVVEQRNGSFLFSVDSVHFYFNIHRLERYGSLMKYEWFEHALHRLPSANGVCRILHRGHYSVMLIRRTFDRKHLKAVQVRFWNQIKLLRRSDIERRPKLINRACSMGNTCLKKLPRINWKIFWTENLC